MYIFEGKEIMFVGLDDKYTYLGGIVSPFTGF